MFSHHRVVAWLCFSVVAAAVPDAIANVDVHEHEAAGATVHLNHGHAKHDELSSAVVSNPEAHPQEGSHVGKASVAALELAASESDGGSEIHDVNSATAPQALAALTAKMGRSKAKMNAKASEESTWLYFGVLIVVCFYLIIWRAFNLASEDKLVLLPPRPPPGVPQDAMPNPTPTSSASPLPVISPLLVSVTRDFPLAIPLDALSQGPVWSINVTGCTGIPLLNAIRRVRDPNDVSQGDISIMDCGTSRGYVAGANSELQLFDGQNRLFGNLEEHETNTQHGTRFILREASGLRTRICFDYAHDTGDIGVLSLPQGARVAMLLRKVGTFGSRRGNFLELMIHPGADAVLITACVLCILNFVPPPERLPQKTGYTGPMGENVNGALAEM